MELRPFHFVFEGATPTDRSASALSVVGMCAYIHKHSTFLADFDVLVNHARTGPSIRSLVLLFDSFDLLRQPLNPLVEVLAPVSETIEILLAYETKEEHKAVGVDLVTLELNGALPVASLIHSQC